MFNEGKNKYERKHVGSKLQPTNCFLFKIERKLKGRFNLNPINQIVYKKNVNLILSSLKSLGQYKKSQLVELYCVD